MPQGVQTRCDSVSPVPWRCREEHSHELLTKSGRENLTRNPPPSTPPIRLTIKLWDLTQTPTYIWHTSTHSPDFHFPKFRRRSCRRLWGEGTRTLFPSTKEKAQGAKRMPLDSLDMWSLVLKCVDTMVWNSNEQQLNYGHMYGYKFALYLSKYYRYKCILLLFAIV